ncbi:MAG: hypothetical protein GTO03_13255 [Planctomycetales bacterium]|nr:hypothetical protein [Planctomycetales bacterium]
MLRFGLPAAAIALNDKQFRLAISLATHAARRGLNITELLGTQLPSVARSVSPEQLTAGLRLALHLEEQNIALKDFFRSGLVAVVEISETDEQFTRNLDLVAALVLLLKRHELRIDPPLMAMTSGCEDPDDFRRNVETLSRFALQAHEPHLSRHAAAPRFSHHHPPHARLLHGDPE